MEASAHHESHMRLVATQLCIGIITLVSITAILRGYVRMHISKAFGLDDVLMIFASIFCILYCTFSIANGFYDADQNVYLDPNDFQAMQDRFVWWLCRMFYFFSTTLAKLSIGYLLLRLTLDRMHKRIVWIIMIQTGVTFLGFFLPTTFFNCRPIAFFWNQTIPGGKCTPDQPILLVLFSVSSIVTDFALAAMPIWVVSRLPMQRRKKTQLGFLMALGCVASSAVVVRFTYIQKLSHDNFSSGKVQITIWSALELGLSIIAGSIVPLWPLVARMQQRFPRIMAAMSRRRVSAAARTTDSGDYVELEDFAGRGNGPQGGRPDSADNSQRPLTDNSQKPLTDNRSHDRDHSPGIIRPSPGYSPRPTTSPPGTPPPGYSLPQASSAGSVGRPLTLTPSIGSPRATLPSISSASLSRPLPLTPTRSTGSFSTVSIHGTSGSIADVHR